MTQSQSTPKTSASVNRRPFLLRLLHRRESGIFLALLVLMCLITAFQHNFATGNNFYVVGRQIAYTAIVALGVFFVIVTSGIDLSIGSVVGLSGVICGLVMAAGVPPFLAVGIGLLTGITVGLINGAVVAYLGVTPFIVTLGMLSMARGLVFVITRGDSIRAIPEAFIKAGLRDVFGIPMPVIVLGFVGIIAHLVSTRSVFGRQLYALGGNEQAAALSGIKTRQVKIIAYAISGMLSSVTGIMFVARFRSAQANAGLGMELDAIAAAVIGGTSLMGGEGSVLGVLLGASIMGVLRNGLVLMEVSSYWQELIIGLVIVLAAVIDVVRRRWR
jgi:ribose transport system permease protein